MHTNPWLERYFPNSEAREGDHRSPFQRDKARVLHSAAFRRLQAKTQVLGVGQSDFYRTRLTHSLEAAQIGTGIAAQLKQKYPVESQILGLDETLVETLCLAHDIGHPPFGHGGEVALNYMMRDAGGFEGNGQTFRIITKLEPYTAKHGMNLCRRSILGLVKYPNFMDNLLRSTSDTNEPASFRAVKAENWQPAKGLYRCDAQLFDWLLSPLSNADKDNLMAFSEKDNSHARTLHKSFDCSIMELADDIAYAIHDLEDAIVMGMIDQSCFTEEIAAPLIDLAIPWLSEAMRSAPEKLFSREHHIRKNTIGGLVNCFITAIEIAEQDTFEHQLLRYRAQFPQLFEQALSLFKRFVYQRVIRQPDIQMLEYKGQQVVMELFEAFHSDPQRLLPLNTRERWLAAKKNNDDTRIIADYISGMTDEFALRLYSTLFTSR